MKYPELNGNQWIAVELKLKGQSNWREGMFYRNGANNPIFASYGSDITNKVEEWRYRK